MKNTESNGQPNRIEKSTTIKGEINSNADFRIDGTLEGSITTSGKVVIGKEGLIKGEINCSFGDIEGKFEGKLKAKENLTLRSTSNTAGDVVTGKLIVELGAVFNASCIMKTEVDNNTIKNHKK